MLFRQIEYLQAVVETGSFYQAAERCHVSQSAISQQIKKLEEELDVKLLDRHNRTFTLTPAGEHFYRKSLIIMSDIEQMKRETKRIADHDHASLRIGYYKGYNGNELTEAVAEFSQKYPTVEVSVISRSHDELYEAMEKNDIDLALNDQRRAFSDAYNNEVLAESRIYAEISSRNPLSRLDQLEISELKNTACILVINSAGRQEEERYYGEVVGIKGDFLFADSLQEARMKVITGQGYLPVDVIGSQPQSDSTIARIPLVRNGDPVRKNYCAFWRKDNSGYYIEDFAKILQSRF
ncbi:LysR family transcriptional regulator [Lactobacillus nasalidis]|uniref:LysR family transcriptional regulator n=1 Tax=Lactobacillus nasalidis TaxID=2797258 RepID=UPI001916A268|nr:LysR family transcriptional regulator [Lactobacillus nasalidis]GHV97389.1 LysR family transcriptional regulator [Lactobacillus nasalidis]GHV99294.1 LysR family transcriptional regulator [Lactobacillus nasalidis]